VWATCTLGVAMAQMLAVCAGDDAAYAGVGGGDEPRRVSQQKCP